MGWRVGASRLPSRMGRSPLFGRALETTSPSPPFQEGRRACPKSSDGAPRKRAALRHRVEGLLEAAGMGFLGLGQGLEPVGDLVEAFLAGGARHAGIHVGVFMRL